MSGWFQWLCEGEPAFVSRGRCGDWGTWLPSLYVAADLAIAFAYFAIPLSLLWLWRGCRSILPHSYILAAFALFIFLCGLGHLIDAASFCWPAYRLNTFERLATAFVSLIVAVCTVPAVKHLSGLPSPEEFAKQKEKLILQAQALEHLNATLTAGNRAVVAELDKLKEAHADLYHKVVTEDRYQELRERLHEVRNALLRRG